MNADQLFPNPSHQAFPVCTQVTLCHGICDSGCITCPIGRIHYGDAGPELRAEFPPGQRCFMPEELFRRVADEVAGHPHAWLRLHARGEPLLHPRLIEMIAYAKTAGVRLVQTFTDAIALTEEKARGLLNAGLDVLECSVHGHTDTYERLMRNGKFSQVKQNIIRFRRLRDEIGAKTRLVVSAVDQPALQPEKSTHLAFWQAYADEVIYRPMHSWGNRIALDGALPKTDSRRPCAQLWTRCTIGPTGKVLACFNSWSEPEEEVLGNLSDPGRTIEGIWQSAQTRRMRQDHLDGDYSIPCCRTCHDWTGSAWGENSYENLLENRLWPGETESAC